MQAAAVSVVAQLVKQFASLYPWLAKYTRLNVGEEWQDENCVLFDNQILCFSSGFLTLTPVSNMKKIVIHKELDYVFMQESPYTL